MSPTNELSSCCFMSTPEVPAEAQDSAEPPECLKAPTSTASPRFNKIRKPPTPLTCLFCHGNPRRARTQRFARRDSLRRHYRQVHFQYQVGPFLCPLPDCFKIIQDSDHFANHATTVHKSDLGVRAAIRSARARTAKPGQLAPFVI